MKYRYTHQRQGRATRLKFALMTCLFLSASSYGISPLGAPRALTGDQKWTMGFNLGHQTTDLTLSGSYYEKVGSSNNPIQGQYDLKDLKSTTLFAQLGYGATETWDLFLLLGASDAQGDTKIQTSGMATYIGKGELYKYDSSMNFAWGLGTRVTLYESADISWGASGQVTWHNPSAGRSSWTNPTDTTRTLDADLDLKFIEIQLAAGPTLNFGSFWLYGGPFLHIINGDMSLSGTYTHGAISTSGPIGGDFDVEQESEIGLYLGGQWLVADNVYWYADGQFTGNAWGIGLGGLWRVE